MKVTIINNWDDWVKVVKDIEKHPEKYKDFEFIVDDVSAIVNKEIEKTIKRSKIG